MRILVLTLLLCPIAWSQTVPADQAAIYVYSFHANAIGTLRKSIMLDGKDVADITPGRYFILLVTPGKHSLHFKDKKRGGIERDFQAGTVSYLRVGWSEGVTIKPSGIDLVSNDNGAFDVKQLRPVVEKNIRDTSRVKVALP
jgi:hypothetical protein